jgi:prevent-host-death family protein
MISESLSPSPTRTIAPAADDVTTIATTIGIRALARNVSAVVGDVVASGLPVVLTKHGRPVAAIVPIERFGE